MVTVNGVRDRVKNTQQKEEKMNARKVVYLVCVLVVGLLVLESPALAGPWGVEYWLGERPVYGANGNPVAPRVSVPLYGAQNSKPPSFYRGWSGGYQAVPNLAPLYGYPPGNKVAPKVQVPQYKAPSAGPLWRR
jgi:hypothetical protein